MRSRVSLKSFSTTDICIEAASLSAIEAKILGVTLQTLSRVLNGKTSVSFERVIRVSIALSSTPERWLHLQMTDDRAKLCENVGKISVE